MEDIIDEGNITGSVSSIKIRDTETILNQMKTSICIIDHIVDGYKKGTGFFCNIDLGEKKIPCLLTNYHVLDENYIREHKKIIININDRKINEEISINENDILYLSRKNEYDLIIIKLDKRENYINYLELDDNLFNMNSILGYKSQSIYILHYPYSENASVSYGYSILPSIRNKYDIVHKCNTSPGSSGGPILNLSTNKVIGIHKGSVLNEGFNIGSLLKYPLNSLNNEIRMKIKINENDINKIYAPPIDEPPPIKNPHYRNLRHPNYYPVALENVGATCYMNATLQCLCNIEEFLDFFKYNKHLIEKVREDVFTFKKNEKLCSSFKFLIENLYPNPGRHLKKRYAPIEFKEKICEMNSLFKGVVANDPKDLINFLIMTLHGELNKIQNPVDVGGGNLFQEQTNKALMFKRFAANFVENNQSIIINLFYALNCNVTKCGNCQVCSFNYQIYFFLIFPLEEVRKFKYGNNNFYNTVDIYDCFNFDQKICMMGGENSMDCNYCKQTSPYYMYNNLTTGPKILIIILNRGKGFQFNVRINFYETLNLQNYIELRQTGTQYRLIGVITVGDLRYDIFSGNLTAYCLNFIFNKWFKFNDVRVKPVNNFQNDVFKYTMPSVLFYQKIDGN